MSGPATTEKMVPLLGSDYEAVQQATLWPFSGGRKVFDEMVRFVQSRRQARIYALAGVGWSATQATANSADVNLRYLLNCPPAGVKLSYNGLTERPCNRVRVCPFCYGRRVVLEAYRAMECALFAGAGAGQECVWPYYKLVASVRQFAYPRRMKSCYEWLKTTQGARYAEVDLWPPTIGAILSVSQVPGVNDPSLLVICRRTVALVPASFDAEGLLPEIKHGGTSHFKQVTEINRPNLASLLGWALRYPPGALSGDPVAMTEILHTAAPIKAKLWWTYRAFHNAGIRQARRKT